MSTLGQLAEAARSEVYGYTATIEPTTYLSGVLPSTADKVYVVSAAQFSRGIVEVGDELLMIDEVDRDNDILSLSSVKGRGILSTTAQSWPVGTKVTMSPMIPVHAARRAISEALRADSGLFVVKEATFTYVAAQSAYTLPADWENVLSVQWKAIGPSEVWVPVRRWTADRFSDSLVLGESPVPGQTVRVRYSTQPTVGGPDDDFSVTGLPTACEDVIRWSAAWRLSSMLEPFNLGPVRAEAATAVKPDSPSSRLRVAQYFYQMYQQRLMEEVRSLQNRWPVRVHFTGLY